MALEFIAPEIWGYLKQSNKPLALKVIESRYLFIQYEELTQGDATFFPRPGTFNILVGSKQTEYRNFQGAFVYDMRYQKWGHLDVSPTEPGV